MLRLAEMKVWLVFLVILVSNQVSTQGSESLRTKDRQSKQLNEPEQKYDLELSFPITSDEAINAEGRVERIDELIQAILNNEELADVDDRLPLTLLDPNSIQFDTNYKCESGQVVVDGQCVPCQPGTYYNEAEKVCTKCAIGFYNSDFAKLACTKCPLIQDVEGITKAEGADTIDDCKQRCSVGQKYSDESGICINCGFGKYQPKEGQFECLSCGNGLTTRSGTASSVDECRPDCLDGFQMGPAGECEVCPVGSYRSRDKDVDWRECRKCPEDRTTSRAGSKSLDDCSIPICVAGHYLNATYNDCVPCEVGKYQSNNQETYCLDCPAGTSTASTGSTGADQCIDPCKGDNVTCHKHAICLFKGSNKYECQCKHGYKDTSPLEQKGRNCVDKCDGYCRNNGVCLLDKQGEAQCQCAGSFTGKNCAEKSEFAYIAGGIAGAVLFVIVLVLLVWMICVRSARNRQKSSEKFAPSVGDMTGSQVNFYYGAPAPYAESIAPSHHGSTYAHYYEDEEDGWGMPNFYDTYGKNSKMARSNGSLYNAGMYAPQYAPQGELYDRLGKHAYQPRPEDKSGNDTTSESDGQ